MDDYADHTAVINLRNPSNFVRQQRPKPLELIFTQQEHAQNHAPAVAEPESHSRLQGNPVYGS
ncbi:hypothetical protein [Sphingomonas sp. PvP056]|uniref:hypothetical protein n=1 Tax=Sphingomonas sp. PvP056 TaxID=3156392 RepID=UPI003394670C